MVLLRPLELVSVKRGLATGFELSKESRRIFEALLPLMPSVLEQLAAVPPGRTEIFAARPPA